MKKFQFRLQALLRFREHEERKAQLEVAEARTDLAACDKRIEDARQQYHASSSELAGQVSQGLDARRYLMYRNYLRGIGAQVVVEKNKRHKLQGHLREKQKQLTQRSVQKKVLENFKDKQKQRYYQEMLTKEQKENDDHTLLRRKGLRKG